MAGLAVFEQKRVFVMEQGESIIMSDVLTYSPPPSEDAVQLTNSELCRVEDLLTPRYNPPPIPDEEQLMKLVKDIRVDSDVI